jgi:hypothetical protein
MKFMNMKIDNDDDDDNKFMILMMKMIKIVMMMTINKMKFFEMMIMFKINNCMQSSHLSLK